MEEALSLPYLLFTVGKNTYGISSEFVRNIEILDQTITVTGTDPFIRGGIIYQENFIPLIDMRKLFELDSLFDEFEKTVQPAQRIKDHENWISALEKSVREHTEFRLTDDPHQCAFGKWYYSFQTDNNVLKHQLSAIEAPHEAIHNTAKQIKDLMRADKYELAMSVLMEMRSTHYIETMNILSSLCDTVKNSIKEQYFVVEANDCMKGLIIDSIVGIEYLDNITQMPESMSNTKYAKRWVRRKKEGAVVFILEHEALF